MDEISILKKNQMGPKRSCLAHWPQRSQGTPIRIECAAFPIADSLATSDGSTCES